ncbi:MAG TPA: hypothetical protein VGT44_13070 [Ktedonobacteraceae bacterium]|nr:hypothetical protein [Ktedonobacteraceae bacterium]
MKNKHYTLIGLLLPIAFLLGACTGFGAASTSQVAPQQTVVISKTFQSQLSPLPTVPTYLCGAWASNNAPGPNDTITIFARLTKNLVAVSGATATAVVHFQSGDVTLNTNPVSDNGGYVTFSLSLQGRQPANIPVTVDVTFTHFAGGTLLCTQAFFTPQ